MDTEGFLPLKGFPHFNNDEMLARSNDFYELMMKRRTVRHFSDEIVPEEVIYNCIKTAGTAPSGANMQPWHFVVIKDKEVKRKIRMAAEEEEFGFYHERAPKEWLDALKPFATNEYKPFLESAPFLIAVFFKNYDIKEDGSKEKHYYAIESVGIATGMLIAALHNAGLASLTHTPSPMKFLNEILERPVNEKPFLLLVTGFPAKDAKVPAISRKTFSEITTVL